MHLYQNRTRVLCRSLAAARFSRSFSFKAIKEYSGRLRRECASGPEYAVCAPRGRHNSQMLLFVNAFVINELSSSIAPRKMAQNVRSFYIAGPYPSFALPTPLFHALFNTISLVYTPSILRSAATQQLKLRLRNQQHSF